MSTRAYSDLYKFSCGSYQLRLAPAYYFDHIGNSDQVLQVGKHIGPIASFLADKDFKIDCSQPYLIRARLFSRFMNSVKYYIYILLDLSKFGSNQIIEYCCQCKNGLRTIGSCAHVIAIIWFLGFARHQPKLTKPAQHLDNFFVEICNSDSELSDSDIE